MLARCDSHELSEWQAFERLDPWGEERADLRAGIVAAKIHNVNRRPNDDPTTPGEQMPTFGSAYREAVEQEREAARPIGDKIDAFMRFSGG